MKPDLPTKILKKFFFILSLSCISVCITAQTKTRVTGAANWNANSTWMKPLSGVVTTAFLSKTVVGLGTSFASDLAVNDVICTSSGQTIGTVASISGLTVTLVSNAAVIITLSGYAVEKVPTAADDVEIGNTSIAGAVNVALNVASATVNSLTFIADGESHTLTHSSTNALTVNSFVSINQPTANSKTIAWNINDGTATVGGNINLSGVNATTSRVAKINLITGTLNANADMIFSGSTAATKVIDMSGGAATINLKGALTVPSSSATLTAGTAGSIFNYTGTSAQTVNYFSSGKYYHLYINNTNASGATLSAAIATSNVDGNLSIGNINSGSLLNSGNYAIGLNNSRTLTVALGSTMNAGTSVVSFGTGTPNLTINGTFKTANTNGFSGSTTTAINATNPPTFLLGAASTIEYNSGSNQVVSSRNDYANIAVSGGATKTANGSITANTNLNIGSSTTLNASSYTHYMKGSLTSSGTFTCSTSSMVFNGTGAQTIPGLTYNNLQTSTSGTKTMSGAATISGNLTIDASTVLDASSYTHNIAGSFTNNGSFTAGSSTFNFNGSSNQNISGTISFNNLTQNNAAEIVIANSTTINGSLTLSSGRFNINGKTLRLEGSFSGNASNALKGSQASNLIVGYSFTSGTLYFDQTAATYNNYLRSLTVNSSATTGNYLNITADYTPGTIDIAAGATLNTNDYVTLKSDSTGTARLAQLPVDGSGAATAFINGKLIMERYIPAGRGWRLLGVPAKSSGAPTINEAWQEGLTTVSANPNLYPGYGVKICGGSSTHGYDTSATINTFIKTYNNATNGFTALPANPGTYIPITSYPAYFLYIRGDRSVNMLQGLAAAITSTTLRIKGQPITGKKDVAVNGTGNTILSNPYPGAIDFHTLAKSNVADAFYAWDPKLAGTNGIGGYVTFIWNSSLNNYDATASVSNISQYLQSGQAFFIHSDDNINPGTISINESDKTTLGDDQVSRVVNTGQQVRVNLFAINADSTSTLADGVLTTYDDNNSNSVDNNDAKKIFSSNQSLNIRRGAKALAIERRKTIITNDTTFLDIYQMRLQQYNLGISIQNMSTSGLIALLKDNYAAATNNTILEMNGTTNIPFTVTADPASYAVNRFSIVFEVPTSVPVTFKKVKAYQQQKNINVEWDTENEITTNYYEVERSGNGSSFYKINSGPVNAAYGGSGHYTFIDTNPLEGMNYYRIVSVSAQQIDKDYSNIVRVNMEKVKESASISIYPNPVTGNTINIQTNNIETGTYVLKLSNAAGQLLFVKSINYDAAEKNIEISKKLPAGKYQLSLSGEGYNLNTQLIKK
ncbi:MAG: T9SS type A sorting domain-containing protein [Ferruginibacter sp.]